MSFNESINNAVIHVFLPFMNGGFFDAFEYYCGIKKHVDSDSKFFLVNSIMSKHKYRTTDLYKKITEENLLDKYDIDQSILDDIVYLNDKIYFLRYSIKNIIIVDNHTFSEIAKVTKRNTKNYIISLDPFIPSRTNFKNPQIHIGNNSNNSVVHLFNEVDKWSED